MAIGREQVLAFRLASHGLDRRIGGVVEGVARCGIQETPLGSAALALHSRVENLTLGKLDRALRKDRSLVTLWSLRGAPYVVPSADIGVFTAGALPVDGKSFRQMLGGWASAVDKAGLDPFLLLDKLVDAAKNVLDGTSMDVNDLRDRLYTRIRSLHKIERPDSARDDMPEPLFRALGLKGTVCIVEGKGTNSVLALTDQWLKPTPGPIDADTMRAELARRFLHCYGPATAQHFAEWTQRSLADAKRALTLIEDDLLEVAVAGKKSLILAADDPLLDSPPEAKGIRFLPVHDPYLQQRDRATLLPDQAARRRLWQAVRGPGALLVDGALTGTWRGHVQGDRWEVEIEPFGRLPAKVREASSEEAERMAALKGCSSAAVNVSS
ncbi:MAG TPA: winged helix DNA-binding domain-containing protein [Acidimicrobiia bacterium]|nr:winged helix DNA-binding domain-containing protein [Acidimicrobiia bacterium]